MKVFGTELKKNDKNWFSGLLLCDALEKNKIK